MKSTAVINSAETRYYNEDGKLHREDGPAITQVWGGMIYWALEGEIFTDEKDFNERLLKYKFLNLLNE